MVQRLQLNNVINISQSTACSRRPVDEAQNTLRKDNTGDVGNMKWNRNEFSFRCFLLLTNSARS